MAVAAEAGEPLCVSEGENEEAEDTMSARAAQVRDWVAGAEVLDLLLMMFLMIFNFLKKRSSSNIITALGT